MNSIQEYANTLWEYIRRDARGQSTLGILQRPRFVTSLSAVPTNVRHLAAWGRAKDFARVHEFSSLETLAVEGLPDRYVDTVGQISSLQTLLLFGNGIRSIAPLANLRKLEHLRLTVSRRLKTIRPLHSLPRLRLFQLLGSDRLANPSELGFLTGLRGLALSGPRWGTMRIATLRPLARLKHLQTLALGSVLIQDQSLGPIGQLRQLKYLAVSSYYPIADLARLAAALPKTRGNVLTPFRSGRLSDPAFPGMTRCSTCNRSMVLTNGRPHRLLCPRCDQAAIERHIRRWKALVTAARAA